MRKLEIQKNAKKSLIHIQKGDLKLAKNIAEHIQALRVNPSPNESITFKGYYPYLRIRVGKYRIIYKYSEETLFVVGIGKREDIYEKVKKYLDSIM